MAFYQLIREQKIPASQAEIWDFISSPANLKLITPSYMGFDITSGNVPEKMYEGMIITYKVSPVAGIKTDWMTEITHIKNQEYFVDEQRVGPYKLWHHQHHIFPIEGGVLMRDIVTYSPPFGILGRIANALIIKKKLKEIFTYRYNALVQKYGDFEI
ncbi:MAG: SRPBCC family protein [Bacteroidales bacterium]|nr:SRPBCC family protein [Bacteroidales bacterium]